MVRIGLVRLEQYDEIGIAIINVCIVIFSLSESGIYVLISMG